MKSNTHQLLAFSHVMREGSFSAAAQKLGVTQSALSQHIKNLEEAIGSRLMVRGSKGLELTHAGSDLFDLAEQYASLSNEINERLLGYSKFDTGHLNIVANAPQPALSSIAKYGQAFPNVEISFTLFDWTRTMSMLSDQSVDIAFVTQPRFLPDCIYKKVCETRYVLYVRLDHPLAAKKSLSLRMLENETLILPEKGSLTQKVVLKALKDHKITPRQKMSTTTFPVMKEAILNKIGVGIFLADAAIPNSGLAQIEILELKDSFEIYAATPKHKAKLRLIRTFWDELIELNTAAAGQPAASSQ